MSMSILSGENASLLQGDIDNLKNEFESFKTTHCSDHYEKDSKLYPRINVIERHIVYLQNFMDNLNDRITNLECSLEAFYNNEREKTNNFS